MNPIRAYREARGLSIRDLAAELKCSRSLVQRAELGEAILTPDRAHYWGKLIGADLSSLVSKRRRGTGKTPWRAKAITMVAIAILAGCAHVADSSTTTAVIAQGGMEANPVMAPLAGAGLAGGVGIAAVKLAGERAFLASDDKSRCAGGVTAIRAASWTGALVNAAVLAGAAIAPPVAIGIALAAYPALKRSQSEKAFQDCYGHPPVYVLAVSDQTDMRQACSDWRVVDGTYAVNDGDKILHLYQGECALQLLPADVVFADEKDGTIIIPAKKERLSLFLSDRHAMQLNSGMLNFVRSDWKEVPIL